MIFMVLITRWPMKQKKLFALLEPIMSSDKISDDEKRIYLQMGQLLQKIPVGKIKEYEDQIFRVHEKTLSEKERITYTINELASLVEDEEIDQLKLLSYRTKKCQEKEEDTLSSIKTEISKIQCNHGIMPNFITTYTNVIEETVDMVSSNEAEKPVVCKKQNKKK